MFLPAELKRTKALQFDMRWKAIGQNFDCGCRFLQDTYNCAAFDMALLLQKGLCNFYCYEYHLDSLLCMELHKLPIDSSLNCTSKMFSVT